MNQLLPIIQRAIEHGDRPAVHTATGSHTYSDLIQASHAAASTLLDGGSDLSEAHIAYLVPAGKRYIQAQWGIWRAGGVAVPLSLSATNKELEYTLTDSKANAVMVASELAGNIAPLCERLGLRLIPIEGCVDITDTALPEITSDRRAMILYTSGTTSKPKGVVSTHECIQHQIESLIEAWRWQSDDRIPLFLPLHHIHGIINIMSCALWSGAEIEAFERFKLDHILGRVADRAYSVFMVVPTIYVKLIAAIENRPTEQRDPIVQGFAQMRLMISGSAALPASVHETWTQLTGQKLLERYGMTEIGMAISNPYDGERRPGAVGQPLPGVQIRLQSEAGDLVTDDGVPGEIQVRGPNVFHEYWERATATQDSFVDGWFKTGDIAVLEAGYFRIMGRSSVDIIKSGGYKLSALEIEASLLDHSAIAQCAVVGLPDETWGEIVAVAIAPTEGTSLDLESLQQWCKDRISPYKIPRQLLLLDNLPRNAMGKVTKPAVTKLFATESA